METKKKLALRPFGNRVIAKWVEGEEDVRGGIVLPDSAKKKPETARVIRVGKSKVTDVKEGSLILTDKYSGQEVTFEGEEYVVLKVDDVLAIIEE
ncbi:MAG: co-chaperone GroES [Simkaniaceae bacterium]|nr:co-chaperone GroES [Simkaniaceae bacterium]